MSIHIHTAPAGKMSTTVCDVCGRSTRSEAYHGPALGCECLCVYTICRECANKSQLVSGIARSEIGTLRSEIAATAR